MRLKPLDPARVAEARAEWPHGVADFDEMLAQRELERERQEFFDARPTREGRLRAIAAHCRAVEQGRD